MINIRLRDTSPGHTLPRRSTPTARPAFHEGLMTINNPNPQNAPATHHQCGPQSQPAASPTPHIEPLAAIAAPHPQDEEQGQIEKVYRVRENSERRLEFRNTFSRISRMDLRSTETEPPLCCRFGFSDVFPEQVSWPQNTKLSWPIAQLGTHWISTTHGFPIQPLDAVPPKINAIDSDRTGYRFVLQAIKAE